jgi:hypothetical protein
MAAKEEEAAAAMTTAAARVLRENFIENPLEKLTALQSEAEEGKERPAWSPPTGCPQHEPWEAAFHPGQNLADTATLGEQDDSRYGTGRAF